MLICQPVDHVDSRISAKTCKIPKRANPDSKSVYYLKDMVYNIYLIIIFLFQGGQDYKSS